mmetsp:Transcript_28319/g.69355  ORF Transcript_28319/g.69355 Transcript_28319/m.69355 type:complete len:243 (-) Transcript_28319:934-1662(-)
MGALSLCLQATESTWTSSLSTTRASRHAFRPSLCLKTIQTRSSRGSFTATLRTQTGSSPPSQRAVATRCPSQAPSRGSAPPRRRQAFLHQPGEASAAVSGEEWGTRNMACRTYHRTGTRRGMSGGTSGHTTRIRSRGRVTSVTSADSGQATARTHSAATTTPSCRRDPMARGATPCPTSLTGRAKCGMLLATLTMSRPGTPESPPLSPRAAPSFSATPSGDASPSAASAGCEARWGLGTRVP